MEYFFSLLSLAPIRRALLVFFISGGVFPLVGVFIVVLDLVPLRFALMHGALLGAVIGLLVNSDSILFPLLLNLLIIALLGPFSERVKIGLSNISAFFMILTIALAFILIDKAGIPSMEAFSIFWGNIYALTNLDTAAIIALALVIIGFILLFYKPITAILFNKDIAYVSGATNRILYYFILILTGVTVALSIKIIGALLVDCLLLLPAMTALYFARSIKGLFITAVITGIISSVLGFFISLAAQIQASPAVTLVGVCILCCLYGIHSLQLQKGKRSL